MATTQVIEQKELVHYRVDNGIAEIGRAHV